MDRLYTIISECYADTIYNNNYRYHSSLQANGNSSYMVIPVSGNAIEVPAFALRNFMEYVIQKGSLDNMVVCLMDSGVVTTYASMPSKIQDALSLPYSTIRSFRTERMLKIITGSSPNDYYYGTQGMLLNHDFLPVMMMSWLLEKMGEAEEGKETTGTKYKLVRPILRIAPEVINKSDALKRYIVNKIMPTSLEGTIRSPRMLGLRAEQPRMRVRVEIDQNPFLVRKTAMPSISTTNQELLDIALENLDEIVQ